MAAIASVGDDADKRRADLRLDLGQDGRQRVTVIRVARHRLYMSDELAALRAMQGRGERDLDAELVGPVRLALADALDFGGVQGIDLAPTLMLALLAHPLSQPEVGREKALQFGLAADLARDIAADPTEIGPDRPQCQRAAIFLKSGGAKFPTLAGLVISR